MGVEGMRVSQATKARDIPLPIKPGQNEKISAAYLIMNPAIFRYVLKRVSDIVVAEQITGDVFAQLIEAVNKKKGPVTNLPSYLYQIAQNLITDRRRLDKKEDDTVELGDRKSFGFSSPRDEMSLDEIVSDKHDLKTIYEIANRMSPDVKHALFFFMLDFSLKETAEIMKIEENYVKVLRNRAKVYLKRELARHKSQ